MNLREPLRMILRYCQLLQRRYADNLDESADQMIAFCVEGAGRMDALLTDLLAYLRASSQQEEGIELVPLASALDHALRNLRAAIEEARAIIRYGEVPVVRIAAVRAEQLFQNLIGNASSTAEVPAIETNARQDGEEWIISVQDNGIGIPSVST